MRESCCSKAVPANATAPSHPSDRPGRDDRSLAVRRSCLLLLIIHQSGPDRSKIIKTRGASKDIPADLGLCGAPRGTRTPNRQIRSPPVIVRPLPCGPLVLLTSQKLVLPVRLVCCTPPVGLSSSVKNSVNDGLSRVEHQLPDAVCGRIDWKYALGLELADTGFDASVLSEFRAKLVADDAAERLLHRMLDRLRERGLLASGGRQRTDATRVLAAVRDPGPAGVGHRDARAALEALATAAPTWPEGVVPEPWYDRYGSAPGTGGWRRPRRPGSAAPLAPRCSRSSCNERLRPDSRHPREHPGDRRAVATTAGDRSASARQRLRHQLLGRQSV